MYYKLKANHIYLNENFLTTNTNLSTDKLTGTTKPKPDTTRVCDQTDGVMSDATGMRQI